jgi:RNA recognition motif-containing protein
LTARLDFWHEFVLSYLIFSALQIQKEDKSQMKNIFVGNLSFSSTEQDIRRLFEAYGQVDRVNIVTDRDSGQPRGFGFVEMSDNSEGDRAIAALNGHEVGGRALNVNEARPKGEGGGGGNRGGGGGYGRKPARW